MPLDEDVVSNAARSLLALGNLGGSDKPSPVKQQQKDSKYLDAFHYKDGSMICCASCKVQYMESWGGSGPRCAQEKII